MGYGCDMPRRKRDDDSPPPPPPEFEDALGIANAIHMIRNGVPVQDAAIIAGVSEDELEAAARDVALSRSAFVAKMVHCVVSAAELGDAKAAAWLLERVSPSFRRPTGGAEQVEHGPERIIEMPVNGRMRLSS